MLVILVEPAIWTSFLGSKIVAYPRPRANAPASPSSLSTRLMLADDDLFTRGVTPHCPTAWPGYAAAGRKPDPRITRTLDPQRHRRDRDRRGRGRRSGRGCQGSGRSWCADRAVSRFVDDELSVIKRIAHAYENRRPGTARPDAAFHTISDLAGSLKVARRRYSGVRYRSRTALYGIARDHRGRRWSCADHLT